MAANEALNMGLGRLLLEIGSYVSTALARPYLWMQGVEGGGKFRCWGLPLIRRHRQSRIVLGHDCQMRNWFSSNELGVMRRSFLSTRYPGAELVIGTKLRTSGLVVCAEQSIHIGDRVTIGANTTIVDSDFHPLNPGAREADPKAGRKAGVSIGNDIFIGMNCIILKGSNIGDNSIVGAGSVVSGSFPPGSIIGGNPARVIKANEIS
jgi:acetyltransferase-like isoleucine patch superfamily enzyme